MRGRAAEEGREGGADATFWRSEVKFTPIPSPNSFAMAEPEYCADVLRRLRAADAADDWEAVLRIVRENEARKLVHDKRVAAHGGLVAVRRTGAAR